MKKISALLIATLALSACGSPSPQEKFDEAFVQSQTSAGDENMEKGDFSLSAEYEILDKNKIGLMPKELVSAFGNVAINWDFSKPQKEQAIMRTQLKFNGTEDVDFTLKGEIKNNQIAYTVEKISYPFIEFIGMKNSFSEEDFLALKPTIVGKSNVIPVSKEDFESMINGFKNAKGDAGISDLSAEEDADIVAEFVKQNAIKITEEKQENGLDILSFEVDMQNFYNFMNAIGGSFEVTEDDIESFQVYGDMTLKDEDFQKISGEIFVGENISKGYGYENILIEFDYDVIDKSLDLTLLDSKNNQEVAKVNFNWKK